MPPRRKQTNNSFDDDFSRPSFKMGGEKGTTYGDFPPIDSKQTNKQNTENNTHMNPIKVIISSIVLIAALVITLTSFKVTTIEGSQLGVLETWNGGVDTNIYQPKTYFLFPGFMKTMFKYDASSQVFVMNDKSTADEGKASIGREKDAYLVQSAEGQDMKISMNLRWRIDPTKLVSIHKTVREKIEEKIIRPVVMRVVKDEATRKKAIDAYSGEGLVALQASIQNALTGSGEGAELKERGVVVENFVIEHIELDPKYIEEIKGKQIATQRTLRAVEEQRAAEAQALVAKATAQAEYNTKLVAQMLISTNMVIQAQAENEKAVIAAKAEQQKLTLTAEGEKQKMALEGEGKKMAMVFESEGILAIGKAEAEVKQLLFDSYKAAGSNAFVQVEVAKALAQGIQNIQGYLPEKMTVNTISGNFMEALGTIMGRVPATATAK